MGYWSEVAVHMNTLAYYALERFDLSVVDECEIHFLDNDEVILYWDYIKWYDSFDEVKAFKEALDYLNRNGYEWYFMRIGEDINDIETIISDSYEYIYNHTPHRGIAW